MSTKSTEVLVLGSGPGGYTAAFRAADLGKKVTMVEVYSDLGGVCLNVGCIPSKALLHAAKVMDEAAHMEDLGISFSKPKIDIKKLRSWVKDNVVGKLSMGISGLAKQRKVEVIQGYGKFTGPNSLRVEHEGKITDINFDQCIISAGSLPIKLPFLPEDPRIMDSTGALELESVPKEMLVIGCGIIGMELGTVYNALGSNVTFVELTPSILPGVDKDLVMPLQKRMKSKFKNILLETKVTKVEAKKDGLYVTFEGKNAPDKPQVFDKILSSVGRAPNGKLIDAEKAGVQVDERGFIPVNNQQRTNVPHIYAIGDIAGNPMLAHKSIPEGKIAAEVICGKKHFFEAIIPSVAYTDPEVAWVGLTENEAKEKGIKYEKGVFPWMACGRSLAIGRDEGVTKVLFDPDTNRIKGCGIVGPNAGDLISEAVLAIEMGCDAEDIALTIHPHPTLAETICQATEMYEGTITDLISPKAKKK